MARAVFDIFCKKYGISFNNNNGDNQEMIDNIKEQERTELHRTIWNIASKDYNISVSTYIEQEDKREAVNITKLNAEIERIVTREDILRREINAIIAEIEGAAN